MEKPWIIVLVIYLVLINIAGFAVMAADKKKARKGRWRIPEKTFFIISLLGGSVGTWAGMYSYRHKTKHWYFVIGIPFILAVQTAAAVLILMRL